MSLLQLQTQLSTLYASQLGAHIEEGQCTVSKLTELLSCIDKGILSHPLPLLSCRKFLMMIQVKVRKYPNMVALSFFPPILHSSTQGVLLSIVLLFFHLSSARLAGAIMQFLRVFVAGGLWLLLHMCLQKINYFPPVKIPVFTSVWSNPVFGHLVQQLA